MATERFEAQIGADIKQFQRKIKQVDKEVREMASAVDIDIDMATREFFLEMEAVKKEIRGVDNKDIRLEIELAYKEFQLQMARLYGMVETMDDYDIDVEVDASITEFRNKLLMAKAMAQGISDETVHLDLDTRGFMRAAIKVDVMRKVIMAKNIVVRLQADYRDFQRNMGRVAAQMRNWGEIFNTQFTGAFISMIPTLSPIITGLIALIGNLGVMIGVIAGQMMILVSALTVTAAAYVGLVAVAIPTIKTLFDETAKLTAEQQRSRDAWDGFVDIFNDLVKAVEGDVLSAFTQGMQAASKILQGLTPLITSVATAFSDLMERFNVNIDSEPITRIFDAFNKYGPEIFTNMSAAIGNLVQGIISMITAFVPAAATWSNSFASMMESFALWSDGLSSSEGFQNFISYIQTNMPLISQIFADTLLGVIGFFTAFGDLASDFIPRLAEIMASFKEWSQTLDQNQGFQNFVNYMRTSGPQVIATLVQLVKAIVNFGVAMAPVATWVLNVATSFLEWFNSMSTTNKIFTTILGLIPVLIGGFMMLMAPLVGLITIFGKTIPAAIKIFKAIFGGVGKVFTSLIPKIAPLIDDVARLALGFLNIATKAGPWLMRAFAVLTGPIGWVITLIITLIQVGVWLYKNWAEVSAWASKAWNAVVKVISSAMTALGNAIKTGWNASISFLKGINLGAIGRNIIQGLINGITSMTGAIGSAIKNIADKITSGFKKLMKIKSPSRVMASIAKWVPAGVAMGIEQNLNPIYKASKKMASAVTLDFSSSLKATGRDLKQMNNLVKSGLREINAEAKKEKRKLSNAERYDIFEGRLSEAKKWNDLTLQEERSYWLKVAGQLKKGTAQQRKALQNAAQLKEDILKQQYEKEQYYLDAATKYNTLSLRDRIRAMQNFSKQYKKGSEQQLAYDEQLYDAKKQLYQDLQSIAQDYQSKMDDIYKDLAQNERDLREEWQKTYDDRVSTLANTWGLFDEVKLTDMIEFADDGSITKQIDLIENLRGQVNTLQDFMQDIFMLENRDLDTGLIEELRALGPKAQAELRALTRMSQDELKEYERLWKLRTELAGKQATSELEGSRLAMEAEIIKLRENAVKELQKLSTEMLREINGIVNGSTAEFNFLTMNLTDIGKAAMQGLIDGMKSKTGELSVVAKNLAGAVNTAMGGIMNGTGFNGINLSPTTGGVNTNVNTGVVNTLNSAGPTVQVNVVNDVDMAVVKSYIDVEGAADYKIKNIKGTIK